MKVFNKYQHNDPQIRAKPGEFNWHVPEVRDVNGAQREYIVLSYKNGQTQQECMRDFIKKYYPIAYAHWNWLNTWTNDSLINCPLTKQVFQNFKRSHEVNFVI